MELTHRQRNAVLEIFSEFERADIEYVVLRKYETLPESLPDEDIDIQICADDFSTALNICRSHGFTNKHSTTNDIVDLISRAFKRPDEAARWLLEKPKDTLELVKNTGKPYSKGSHGYRSVKLGLDGLLLDTKKHLAYRSPMNGERIRVDPYVENELFIRRVKHGDFYVPSPPDRLAHLVCHCIFDKEGTFSEYYVEQCNMLIKQVRRSEQYRNQFEDLLDYLFFDAASLVATRIYNQEYSDLRDRLYKFDDY